MGIIMAKTKTVFFCKECGNEYSKWLGQCPSCKAWNSFSEEPSIGKKQAVRNTYNEKQVPQLLNEVSGEDEARINSGIGEFDRVLGGGIVNGSLVLVGGDPGIGKSTLLLQVCKELAARDVNVLYISGEESLHQIKLRSLRLGEFTGNLLLLSETNLNSIEMIIDKNPPKIMIIDSIQTMYCEDVPASPGSVSQVKESTQVLMKIAKIKKITIFIVGHVTKEGVVAGPRVLEHMVDTVLYFEGENTASYRMLRAVKNRFGSTNEIGIFEMRDSGLCEVSNPSEYMLEGKPEDEPGSVVTAVLEGTRSMLVEIQALICKTNMNIPRRTAAGTDYNRVNLLIAVLEKRLGIQLSFCDAYVNVAGGMKINEPALDLAVITAILSSYENKALSGRSVVFGEVGLTGEVRGVAMAQQRVSEAEKLGFLYCILPKVNVNSIKCKTIKLIGISSVKDLKGILKQQL